MTKQTQKLISTLSKVMESEMNDFTAEKDRFKHFAEDADQAAARAVTAMEAAVEASDPTAYSKAKEAKIEAENAAELYRLKLAKLEKDGPIPEAEYRGRLQDLREAAALESAEATKEIKALGIRIGERASSCEEALEQLKHLMEQLVSFKSGNPFEAVLPRPAVLGTAHQTGRWANGIQDPGTK